MNSLNQNSQASRSSSTTLVDNEFDEQKSCCKLYTANYTGTTCIQNYFSEKCNVCNFSKFSITNIAKAIFGLLINLFCYPFIPCAIAFFPASFQFAGYSNANSLYPCYGKTCCFCIRNQEGNCYRLFCFSIFCLILLSIMFAVWCFTAKGQSQNSLMVINVLLYFENLNKVASIFLFVISFTIVSFPVMWGYVFLNLAAGFLYGFWMGLLLVVFAVTIGLTISHIICKKYFSTCVMNLLRQRSNFEQIEAILQVIDGSSGLKVIALTRLTPIPFGFQNGLFSVSNVTLKYYLLASVVGLLPTQILNCYIASKFRSMDQLIDQENSKLFFFLQIVIGIILMVFVIQRARKELATALQSINKNVDTNSLQVNNGATPTASTLSGIVCTQPLSTRSFTEQKSGISSI